MLGLGRGLAWLAGFVAAVLAAMCKTEEFQASSAPGPQLQESREGLQGLAKGSPGWASKQLPPWLQ